VSGPRTITVVAISFLLTLIIAGSVLWYEIDRSPPFSYLESHFDRDEAQAGETINLTLRIRWARTNCSTTLERTIIGSDGRIYKILDAEGHSTVTLGPPPARILDRDNIAVSTRPVTLPANLPAGVAIHSPNVWERCTSPAVRWGDYLTDIWPIFVGPKGAEAKITIKP
jgi:hypothetical protein